MVRQGDREPLDPMIPEEKPEHHPASTPGFTGLARFAGARRSILVRCPSEISFYNRVGLAVILLSLASGTTWCIALGYVLNHSPQRYWFVGCIWAVFILNLEQLILGTPILRKRWWASLPQLLLRVTLSVAIGILISEPLLLRLNADAIHRQLQQNAQVSVQTSVREVRNFFDPKINKAQNKIDAIRNAEDRLSQRAEHLRFLGDCERNDPTCSISHRPTCGPRCRTFARQARAAEAQLHNRLPDDSRRVRSLQHTINDLTTNENQQIAQARNAIDKYRGLWAREDALWQIAAQHPRAAIFIWFMRVLFLVCDLLPVTTKIFRSLSSDQPYDLLADAERESELVGAARLRAWAEWMRTRIALELTMRATVDRASYEAEAERRVAAILHEPDEGLPPEGASDPNVVIPMTPELGDLIAAAEARGRGRADEVLDDYRARLEAAEASSARARQRADAAERMLQRSKPLHEYYKPEAIIGVGALGEVWRGMDTKLDRPVAIKRLRRELAADADSIKRFKKEARTLAKLRHPNLVAIYDHYEDDEGRPNLVMELINGKSLREMLDEQLVVNGRGFEPRQAVPWIVQSAAGLDSAHEKRIIHRDLKPPNILIDEHNQARVADFGIAADADSATLTHIAGTWNYASPEQLRGERPTPQSDIYSLGLVAYELMVGKPLFRFEGFADALASKRRLPTPQTVHRRAPAVSAALARVLLRALAEDPKQRPQSAGEFGRLLQLASVTPPRRPRATPTAASEAATAEIAAMPSLAEELTTVVQQQAKKG